MTQQSSNNQLTKNQRIDVCLLIASTDNELKECFDKYISEEYKIDDVERLNYMDIGEIARFILTKFKAKQYETLKPLFDKVETLLIDCDSDTENLIVIGLFESLQNICGTETDYHFVFNPWLRPISKEKWDDLIDRWEGNEWRINKDPNKIPQQ